jgi:hypothetical protein
MPNSTVGCLWYGARFDPGFEEMLSGDRFKPSGNKFSSVSIDYDAVFSLGTVSETAYLSGEWMRDREGAIGGSTRLTLRFPRFQCAAGYRFYPEKFISPFGSGPGEHGETLQNESGIYVGFRTTVTPNIRFSASGDYYAFPWRTSRNPLRTTGGDVQAQTEIDFSHSLTAVVRYRVDTREEINTRQREILRGDVDAEPWKRIGLRTRIELVQVNELSRESGWLVYQNVRANIFQHVRIEGRIALFNTDSYQSALYDYESDVGGVFSAPSVFGRGLRWYVLASYSVGKTCTVCVKYSELRKNGVESLGSGYDTIEGGVDNSLHLQVDIAF